LLCFSSPVSQQDQNLEALLQDWFSEWLKSFLCKKTFPSRQWQNKSSPTIEWQAWSTLVINGPKLHLQGFTFWVR
jgi:hypothetical protein